MPKGVAKANLPQKICLRCQRPFSWRKKWERDWEMLIIVVKNAETKRESTRLAKK